MAEPLGRLSKSGIGKSRERQKAPACVVVGETAYNKPGLGGLPRDDLGSDRWQREWGLALRLGSHSNIGHLVMEAESMRSHSCAH